MKDYFDKYFAHSTGRSLLDIRRQELRIATLDLIRYQDMLQQKPNNAMLLSEVDRYKSRIESLELAVRILEQK